MALDVRTKIICLLFCNLLFLYNVTGILEYLLFTSLLFLQISYGQWRKALAYFLFFLLSIAYVDFGNTSLLDSLALLLVGTRRLLPSFMAGGLIFSTTTSYDLVHALRKWYLPESLLLTLAVCLRFLPMIWKTSRQLHRNLHLRSCFTSSWDYLRHPHRYVSYLIVPLLFALLRQVEDLTIAIMTKGLVLSKRPSSAYPKCFSVIDWSFCLCYLMSSLWIVLKFH
ncbi:energy-coupling factor transporter transmembrane protein EcfT [Streptococcus sp. SQ9-PEA]|uniref:Energy-coupling factor transporter transmembrane protein EcfT n=2 Tax=Streptococcus sciuri TaxID=2973939 RepID=A0ABT2F7K7_9STRE|nr:energy-coupling factor transporter transmembrane protein EcfT [Streptococcus sciuri]